MSEARDPDRLIETPDNPVPAGLTARSHSLGDGTRLRVARAPGAGRDGSAARGTVLLLQGRNEAVEKYFETIGDLTAHGYAVVTFDWRGQGASDGLVDVPRRGHISRFSDYLDDLDFILNDVVGSDWPRPLIVLAHSMGGLVGLHAQPRIVDRVDRMVLCAPLVAFPSRIVTARIMRWPARALSLLGLSQAPVRPEIIPGRLRQRRPRPLTSDSRRLKRNMALREAAPQLFLGSPTTSWLAATCAAMDALERSDRIAKLTVPTLLIGAGDDRVVKTQAGERLAWRMRSASSLVVPYARHEMLQEADRFRDPMLEAFFAFADGASIDHDRHAAVGA